MSFGLVVRIGHLVFRWDENAWRWRDRKGQFVSSPLTPEGERKLFRREARERSPTSTKARNTGGFDRNGGG